MNEDTLKRFWAKVNKSGPVPAHCPELGECWEWTASKHRFGYGYFRYPVNGKATTVYAHRIGWERASGPVPDGKCVLHRCDNPACVRAEHLFLGSKKDNSLDMIRKRRGWQPKLNGERCHQSRLTAEKVVLVRQKFASGVTQTAIAKEFGVTIQAINQVVKGRTWRHVP